jgi:hypothetical protein
VWQAAQLTPAMGRLLQNDRVSLDAPAMNDGFTLASVLLVGSGLFCLSTLFFGTKGGFYDSDDYDGNGTAH